MINPSDLHKIWHCRNYATLKSPESVDAEKGRVLHEDAANRIKTETTKGADPAISQYVSWCIEKKKESIMYGIEQKAKLYIMNCRITGKPDFWALMPNGGLVVADLKTGFAPVDAKHQLYFYALALGESLIDMPERYNLYTFTRFKTTNLSANKDTLTEFKTNLIRKLQDWSFNYGAHCGTCHKFKNCHFALQETATNIKKLKFTKEESVTFIQLKPIIDNFYKVLTDYIKANPDKDSFDIKTIDTLYWDKSKMSLIEDKFGFKKLPTPKEALFMGLDIEGLYKTTKRTTIKVKETK